VVFIEIKISRMFDIAKVVKVKNSQTRMSIVIRVFASTNDLNIFNIQNI